MKNFYKKELEKLNGFYSFLTIEKKMSPLTVRDYCKRLLTICREENIALEKLEENIETYLYDYTKGEKIELGQRSHNSYRSALIKFANYVNNGNTIKRTKKPKVELSFSVLNHDEEKITMVAIKLFDENNNLIVRKGFDRSAFSNDKEIRLKEIYIEMLKVIFFNSDFIPSSKILDLLFENNIDLVLKKPN